VGAIPHDVHRRPVSPPRSRRQTPAL
jgi:hypothetical protein